MRFRMTCVKIHAFSQITRRVILRHITQPEHPNMVYAFVQITITNPDSFAAYAKNAGAALEKHGGKAQAVSTAPQRLEGDSPAPSRAVLLSFPDAEAAQAWINDPELADVHALRRGAGSSEITLIA